MAIKFYENPRICLTHPDVRPRQRFDRPVSLRLMTIFTSPVPLSWGNLDVPLLGLEKDLAGETLLPAAAYSLVMDPARLWFVASHRAAASLHPDARPGGFLAGLWQYDVAECFIADPESGRYLEFNLAPNGAWWTCEFTAPRVRADEVDIAMPDVATFSELAADGTWVAAMSLPLDLLRARIGFGGTTRANVTMILGSPAQRFLSAADMGPGEPDFHQPERFSEVCFTPLNG